MRQSEIATMLKKYGHERGTTHVLMRLAEEATEMDSTIKEMVQAIAQMSNVIALLNGVADGMKDRIDGMARHFDDDPRSTRAITDNNDG